MKKKINYILLLLFLFLLLICCYLGFIQIFIKPLYNLQELQTKEWITDLTYNIILGINDKSRYKLIKRKCDFISYWYCYWHFHTKKYTVWIFLHLQNKFSNICKLHIYLYNFENNTILNESMNVNFNDIKTEKINNKIIITCKNNYKQEISYLKVHQ
jgi:hypothetical protein